MTEIETTPKLGVNVFIGQKIRERRLKLGLTLVDVSQNLGVSHQQLQKYEQGSSRISAATLLQISEILKVSVTYFYNGYDILDAGKPVNIYTLHDGEQVLDLLRNRRGMSRLPRPDIIFIELVLPKINGLQLLREVKRDRSIQDIPIVVMSYGLHKKDLTDCYKNYASGYIHKDCNFSRFKSQIKDSINYWSTVCLPNM